MIPPTTLRTPALELRPCDLSTSRLLYEAVRASITELSPWMPWCTDRYALEDSVSWLATRASAWASGLEYDFSIFDRPGGSLIGGVGINQINRGMRFANLGYWVRTGWTGKGVATAAARETARFGFEKLNLNRIEIVAATDNHASRRIAEKVGARLEGILRRRLAVHDRAQDAAMFSLVPEDLGIVPRPAPQE